MTLPDPILAPVMALVLWTCFVLGWMALTRIPYLRKNRVHPQKGERTAELAGLMPKQIQWKADNYNHLMEHPTIFYATAFVWAFIGSAGTINVTLAWVYVGLRVVHSLVHATINKVMLRLTLFALSSVVLLIMAVNAAVVVL
ncbi:MAPEG family protein [Litorivivens sp.]|uniref:MAPEG family protein n=1 Tax=Litorivivens sp. TaxID=2020868 RepID=UPI003565B4DD